MIEQDKKGILMNSKHYFLLPKFAIMILSLLSIWKSKMFCLTINLSKFYMSEINWQRPISMTLMILRLNFILNVLIPFKNLERDIIKSHKIGVIEAKYCQ